MFLAQVTGSVVSTQKSEGLKGVKLLWVQPLDDDSRTPKGDPLVAADAMQAGVGERVLCVLGREAALALTETFVPVDAAIVGHVEDVA
ncbi:MAG: EutN/CcmL family microcompartment protein [Planctomycetota bacterium]